MFKQAYKRLLCRSGQASVELVGMLPIAAAIGSAVFIALSSGVAHELAGNAAHSGAVALAEGNDAKEAAKQSLPKWARKLAKIQVKNGKVKVTVKAPLPVPALSRKLSGHGVADAGEEGS